MAQDADTTVVMAKKLEARRVTRGHGPFAVVAGVAVLLRLAVVLGYPPIMWFNDSFYYINDAVQHTPDNIRPSGYPFFLDLLEPLHSLTLVAVLQALMGMAMGIATYALLRHRGLPWWVATLCSLPVLYGEYELMLEHLLSSDMLFIFLVTIAVVALCWSERPAWKTMVFAGVLVGYAVTVRSVGWALPLVLVVAMLVCGLGWRKTGAFVLTLAVPVLGYMLWFHAETGRFSLGGASGTFLYGRVQSFAECSAMDPPADLRVLCDSRPPADRPGAESYIWDGGTPLAKLTGPNSNLRFTPEVSSLAGRFAKLAIEKQPFSYIRVVFIDTLRTFRWKVVSSDEEGSGPTFQFGAKPTPVPYWATNFPGDKAAQQIYQSRVTYDGPSGGTTRVVSPWATFVRYYAKVFIFRGMMLGLVLLVAVAALIRRWRRGGRRALLPLAVCALLIAGPPATAGFSYRYVAAAVPLACIAAGLAFARRQEPAEISEPTE